VCERDREREREREREIEIERVIYGGQEEEGAPLPEARMGLSMC